MITKKEFKKATGREPEHDDLDRCNCHLTGNIGHWCCGWCKKHNKPRFVCGCIVRTEEKNGKRKLR